MQIRTKPNPSDRMAVRLYALELHGATQVALMADGSVNVFGRLPNTNETGWYFGGWAEDLLKAARAAGDANRATFGG